MQEHGEDDGGPGYRHIISYTYSLQAPTTVAFAPGEHLTCEDRFFAVDDIPKEIFKLDKAKTGPVPVTAIYGVIDGHGGDQAAEYVKEKMPYDVAHSDYFESIHMHAEEAVTQALEEAFAKAESAVMRAAEEKKDGSGACVTAVVIRGSLLCCANVGDCQAILVEADGSIRELTYAHRSTDPIERARIRKVGGKVVQRRMMGVLEPSRTIGDRDIKLMLPGGCIAEPHMTCFRIPWEKGQGPTVIIMATDGVWDALKHEEARNIALETLKDERIASTVSQRIVERARQRGSVDDITAVVVKLF